jgi:hypothetical protein
MFGAWNCRFCGPDLAGDLRLAPAARQMIASARGWQAFSLFHFCGLQPPLGRDTPVSGKLSPSFEVHKPSFHVLKCVYRADNPIEL